MSHERSSAPRFTLGQRVRARAFHTKQGDRWQRHEIPAPPVEGIITAKRNRQNTLRESEFDEYYGRSYSYTVFDDSFEAYDVTFNLHRRPLVCKPEDIEALS